MTKRTISFKSGSIELELELNDSHTSDALLEALPISASANTWGDEIYFSVAVEQGLEAEYQAEVVEMGAVAYWPPGNAVCLFFGPTPNSTAGEIRPASAVNVLGTIKGDPSVLKRVADGDAVELLG